MGFARPLFACVVALAIAGPGRAEPITPAIAEWALQNQADIAARLRTNMATYEEDNGELKGLVDVSAPGWNIYSRDGQLLIAIPVRRNLLFITKKNGEKNAATLARSVIQQINTIPLQSEGETARLDDDAVRVVFIEPAVADIRSGAFYAPTGRAATWSGFQPPVGYAPFGFYPQASHSNACGCH